jgi:hypothetical protein
MNPVLMVITENPPIVDSARTMDPGCRPVETLIPGRTPDRILRGMRNRAAFAADYIGKEEEESKRDAGI